MPSPTPEQLEQVREAAHVRSLSEVEARVSLLSDAQWARTLADLVKWEAVRDSHLKLEGGRDGLDLDKARDRAAIRGRIRLRLGYPEMVDDATLGTDAAPRSCSVPVRVVW